MIKKPIAWEWVLPGLSLIGIWLLAVFIGVGLANLIT